MKNKLLQLFNDFNINATIIDYKNQNNCIYFDLKLNNNTKIKDIESRLSEIRISTKIK